MEEKRKERRGKVGGEIKGRNVRWTFCLTNFGPNQIFSTKKLHRVRQRPKLPHNLIIMLHFLWSPSHRAWLEHSEVRTFRGYKGGTDFLLRTFNTPLINTCASSLISFISERLSPTRWGAPAGTRLPRAQALIGSLRLTETQSTPSHEANRRTTSIDRRLIDLCV